jgi:hypothetical protein
MKKITFTLSFAAVAVTAALASTHLLCAQGEKGLIVELPAVLKVEPLVAKEKDEQHRKLRIARYNAALSEARKRFQPQAEIRPPGYTIGAIDQAVVRLFQAEFALAEDPQQCVKACENYVALAKHLEEFVSQRVRAGQGGACDADIDTCRYLRIAAEIRLLDEKAGRKRP